jgi:PEP-CTERM putative exosortase interaction domain
MKKQIIPITALLATSLAYAQTAFDGSQSAGGDYTLDGTVSLTTLHGGAGHWVNATDSMSITGTTSDAIITGTTTWWLLNEGASGMTTLSLTDVSMKDIVTNMSSNSATAVTVGVQSMLNITALNHDVYITNNTTSSGRYGGAIILETKGGAEGKPVGILNLTANGHNIFFSGNSGTGPGKAIYVDQHGGIMNFNAKAGSAITFEDNVYMRNSSNSQLNIGDSSGDFEGKVSFLATNTVSGSDGSAQNRLQNVMLNSGTFEFVLTSTTTSNVTINSLEYAGGDFNFLLLGEGFYNFALASTVDGFGSDMSIFKAEGYDLTDIVLSGNNLSFTATIAVPEPGTYAMIFGALALAFAAYRRRK